MTMYRFSISITFFHILLFPFCALIAMIIIFGNFYRTSSEFKQACNLENFAKNLTYISTTSMAQTSSILRVQKLMNQLSPRHDAEFLTKLLDVIEHGIIPKTQTGVANGNKIFGAAVLDQTGEAIYCGTNKETECPLYHGEMSTIKDFYDRKLNEKHKTEECIFLSTHGICMCTYTLLLSS